MNERFVFFLIISIISRMNMLCVSGSSKAINYLLDVSPNTIGLLVGIDLGEEVAPKSGY